MITFREYVELQEKNHNGHGGDRSTYRSQIRRMIPKTIPAHNPVFSPKNHFKKHKNKLFKF
jgi:hypothetical protein